MVYFIESLNKLYDIYPFPIMILNADKKPEIFSALPSNNIKDDCLENYPKLTIVKPLDDGNNKRSIYDQMKLELIELASQFYDHNMKTVIICIFLSVKKKNLVCDFLMASYDQDELQPFETEKNKLEQREFNCFLDE